MARPMKPLVRSGGYYPSRKWIPLVYQGGYTTANGGEQPEPEAVLKTVTGSLIHITDALALPAKALSVNVEPIQDLHGQASPYPAGGGVNLLDPAKCSAFEPSATYGLTVTHDQATAIWTISGTPTLQSASLGFNFCTYSDFSLSGKGYQVQAFPISGTPIKNVYGFRTEAENKIAIIINTVANPTVNMTFKVSVAATSQTAWSPYSNICPISGRTSATIYHNRYNFIDQDVVTLASGWARSTDEGFTEYNGAPVYKGLIIELYRKFGTRATMIPVKAETNKRYVVKIWWRSVDPTTANGLKVCLFYDDGTEERSEVTNANQTWKASVLLSAQGKTVVGIGFTYNSTFQIYAAGLMCMDADSYFAMGDDRISFVATDSMTTVPITFPDSAGTVYGGTLDVTGGVLTVDRAIVLNSTKALKYENANGYYWYTTSGDLGVGGIASLNAKLISNRLHAIANVTTSSLDGEMSWYANNIIRWKEQGSLTLTEYRDYLASNPLQFCYELAQPIEITLTPTQIDMLLGTNNLWADAGDSTLTYYADGNASTSEALGILLGGTYNNTGGADDVSDDEALGILLGGS